VGLEIERQTELADAMADDPEPNLAVAEGYPLLRSIVVGFRLIKAGNTSGQNIESSLKLFDNLELSGNAS
jgi:hypothetical protein